jgi:serine-type D-Ala-D-Ala carboxypeptidase/endopeptidase
MIGSRRLVAGMAFCSFLALVLCTGVTSGLAQEQKEIAVSPKVLQQYVGVYELAPTFKLSVTVEGSQLMVQASGQPKLPVFASSDTKFFYKVVDARIEFFKDAKGAVSHLVLYQNNQEMKAPRISSAVAAERKEITVSPSILAQYPGTYELQPGFDLVVTLEGSNLMTQATGQGKVQVFPETETKFFLKVTDAQIEFFKDSKGAVTYLVLHQGPAEIKAMKK